MAVRTEPSDATAFDLPEAPRWRTLRLLLSKRIAVVCILVLVVFYGAAILAPWVAPADPNEQEFTVEAARAGPSAEHWFGTDQLGRDLLSRVIYAARTTVLFTVAVVITGGLFLGLGLGLLAGYRGGWIDNAIMRLGEILAGVPVFFLMLIIRAAYRERTNDLAFWLEENTFLGADADPLVDFVIITAVAVPFAWVGLARIVRSQVLAIREQEFVLAAEAMGISTPRLLLRHILPGVMPIYLVGLSSSMAGFAFVELGLSWLGLGVDPSTPSFGTMIEAAGRVRTFEAFPHLLLVSATPIIIFFFAWNLLGDALVDIVEPRTHRR